MNWLQSNKQHASTWWIWMYERMSECSKRRRTSEMKETQNQMRPEKYKFLVNETSNWVRKLNVTSPHLFSSLKKSFLPLSSSACLFCSCKPWPIGSKSSFSFYLCSSWFDPFFVAMDDKNTGQIRCERRIFQMSCSMIGNFQMKSNKVIQFLLN